MLEPVRAGRADWHTRVVFGSYGIIYALEVRMSVWMGTVDGKSGDGNSAKEVGER
jgi:hypothetical protein